MTRLDREIDLAIDACGMRSFRASASHFTFEQRPDAFVLPLVRIAPIERALGKVCIDLERGSAILTAIREGIPLPPIVVHAPLPSDPGGLYSLYNGFHRLKLSAALGFTHIGVVVAPRLD